MTTEEVRAKRVRAALSLFRRSGVGYICAVSALGREGLKQVELLTWPGDESDQMVQAALQFAFQQPAQFRDYLGEQNHRIVSHRDFKVRG